MSERVRSRVEMAGRVELSDSEAAKLVRTRADHILLIVIFILVGVYAANFTAGTSPLLVPIAFLAGGVAEVCREDGKDSNETTSLVGSAARIVGEWLLGLLAFAGFAQISSLGRF